MIVTWFRLSLKKLKFTQIIKHAFSFSHWRKPTPPTATWSPRHVKFTLGFVDEINLFFNREYILHEFHAGVYFLEGLFTPRNFKMECSQ